MNSEPTPPSWQSHPYGHPSSGQPTPPPQQPGTPESSQPPQYGQQPPQYGQGPQYGQQPQPPQDPRYGQQPQQPQSPWATPSTPTSYGRPAGEPQPTRPSWGPTPAAFPEPQPPPPQPLSYPPYPGAPPAGMTAHGPYWMPGAPPPPRSPWPRRIGLLVLVAVLAAASIITGAFIGRNGVQLDEALQPVPPRPSESASDSEWEEYVSAAAQAALNRQSTALLAGDEEGWLALYDGSDADLVDRMKERYDSLRALEVTNWTYKLDGKADSAAGSQGDERAFDIDLVVGYCFGSNDPPNCPPTDVVIPTEWESSKTGLLITDVEESSPNQAGPRPFEVSNLAVKSGPRVLVAAPPQYENRLTQALEVAEAAAENADKYAHWAKVDRYVVFLAGEDEFAEWYGTGDIGANVVGFALPLGTVDDNGDFKQTGIEVVMHVERLGNRDEFNSTMRHEFGHVVTLLGTGQVDPQPEDWFLNEGVAEYIDHGDQPVSSYPRLSNVKDYLSTIRWKGELVAPTATDDGLAGSGKYGLAFLAVRYIIDTYGIDKFYQFFEAVARNGEEAAPSSEAAFGESWSGILTKVEDFVNASV